MYGFCNKRSVRIRPFCIPLKAPTLNSCFVDHQPICCSKSDSSCFLYYSSKCQVRFQMNVIRTVYFYLIPITIVASLHVIRTVFQQREICGTGQCDRREGGKQRIDTVGGANWTLVPTTSPTTTSFWRLTSSTSMITQ